VPAEFGGPSPAGWDAFPEVQRLQRFVEELRAGGDPYLGYRTELPPP
jgi:hypothetical protein